MKTAMQEFYCNQDDGEYNNNPCTVQCNFCKSAESLNTESDNSNQLEKLKADKAELLEALGEILEGKKDGRTYISTDEIESLIQKMKQ